MAVGDKMEDVEMKDDSKPKEKDEEEQKDPDLQTMEDLRDYIKQIEKSVATKESRFTSRTLRALITTRRRLNHKVLWQLTLSYLQAQPRLKADLQSFLTKPDDLKCLSLFRPRTAKTNTAMPELETYIHLLVLMHLIDSKRFQDAVRCADSLMENIVPQNRRSLDILAAKCYFYYARAYELTDQLDRITPFLHSRLRTSTLRSDFEGQAVLLNLLLRSYLQYNLVEQADKLVSKSTFPESASNNEWARYLYYLGRIKATQLNYSEAHKNLLSATRKAPQHSAVGFKQAVYKLAITVELLLGDIPDRDIFRQPSLKTTLAPYFQLTQAVRRGNLAKFNEVLGEYRTKFEAEKTFTLIVRLRHNVIKTGVRMINLSYYRISLSDIAEKLQLDSPEDAEYIVAKAIRDGVIEAKINHEDGFVQSKETMDIYSTREPMTAFHQRISFCLDMHNQSVKAMRFPPKSYNKDLESAEERREREQQELESAKEIAEDDYDGFP